MKINDAFDALGAGNVRQPLGRNPGLVDWEWYKDSLKEGRERGKTHDSALLRFPK